MGQPVVHWEIAAKDGKKAQEFYAKLFDWNISVQQPMNYGLVETGGQGGINGGIHACEGRPPSVTFYVQGGDLQASLAKAETLGGKTGMGPMPIHGPGSIAMFQDPDGNCLRLFKGQ